MSTAAHKVCAWSGIAFVVLLCIAFLGIAGLIPPPSPDDTPQQIADLFRDHATALRVGLVLGSTCCALVIPFFVGLSFQLARIEGGWSPMSVVQVLAGALSCLELALPMFVWQTATFRPERSPEAIQLLNDLGWLPFIGLVCTTLLQGVAIGWVILSDTEGSVLPRWAGYFNIWAVSLIAPGGIIVFFKTGPFAWDGIIAFWLVAAAYFSWIIVNACLLLRAIRTQDTAGPPATDPEVQRLSGQVDDLREQVARLSSRLPA